MDLHWRNALYSIMNTNSEKCIATCITTTDAAENPTCSNGVGIMGQRVGRSERIGGRAGACQWWASVDPRPSLLCSEPSHSICLLGLAPANELAQVLGKPQMVEGLTEV